MLVSSSEATRYLGFILGPQILGNCAGSPGREPSCCGRRLRAQRAAGGEAPIASPIAPALLRACVLSF